MRVFLRFKRCARRIVARFDAAERSGTDENDRKLRISTTPSLGDSENLREIRDVRQLHRVWRIGLRRASERASKRAERKRIVREQDIVRDCSGLPPSLASNSALECAFAPCSPLSSRRSGPQGPQLLRASSPLLAARRRQPADSILGPTACQAAPTPATPTRQIEQNVFGSQRGLCEAR